MTGLLTETETDTAARLGYELCWVVDEKTLKVFLSVLPTPNNPVKSASRTLQMVVGLARERDGLAIKVLQLVTASMKQTPIKPQRKKREAPTR